MIIINDLANAIDLAFVKRLEAQPRRGPKPPTGQGRSAGSTNDCREDTALMPNTFNYTIAPGATLSNSQGLGPATSST